MQKVFLVLIFLLSAQIGMAQNDDFKTDVIKFISISGADAQMKVMKSQILKIIPEEKQTAFQKEFDATMPSLYDKMAKVYMGIYSREDIKEMIKFYESPVGKKMNENTEIIAEKLFEAGQDWGIELQEVFMKYK